MSLDSYNKANGLDFLKFNFYFIFVYKSINP